ncbi:MAG TPA: radical SAM protein [Candidatus Glassbacteria bacterium]|nr:radical SAM protein [Candidatus Glassbacteria bacterium]
MIDITKLLVGESWGGDAIRYGHSGSEAKAASAAGRHVPKSAAERRPVVVWNITRRCNLHCVHCYTDSENVRYKGEMTTEEGKALLDELARFQVPAVLISGGEPLVRKDVFELVRYAVDKGLRPTLSTNGTLIDAKTAKKIKEAGFTYVGVSLDGIGEVNDCFRGMKGAFELAMRGFRNLVEIGQRVGLRLTLTRQNYQDLEKIFDFIEAEKINRACFYHLVYSGRGAQISSADLTHRETRQALDIILRRTLDFHKRGLNINTLTVDNHVDSIYLLRRLEAEGSPRAAEVRRLLEWNQGGMYSTGVGVGEVDWFGNVHPDQFWMDHTFGNVRERKFSEIWTDITDPLMAGLKDRPSVIKGRCRLCKYFKLCGGAMRVRAQRVYDDPFGPDPACYLTDEEIGLDEAKKKELERNGEIYPFPEKLLE